MNEPGAILLVSCYELGHQPFNLASPLTILTQAGYRPAAVDTAVEELPDDAIARAKVVAISVPMHTALRLGERVARRVREVNPEAHIAFYGLYAWLNAAYLLGEATGNGQHATDPSTSTRHPALSTSLADSVIGGEFEEPLMNLVWSLEMGSGPADGVRFRGTDVGPYLERTTFAVPRREGLPGLDHYAGFWRDGEVARAGYVEATRGCKHTCLHCPITPVYKGRFFVVPRNIVLTDIRNQVAAGAGHITFGDPDFLNGPTHALKIVRQMRQEFPDVTFDATIKIEHVLRHRRLFPELRELGCAFVVSAVESLSDDVLRHLRKGHTKQDVFAALDVMDEAGIPLRPSLVSFTPWTTLADYLEVLHFVEGRGIIDAIDPVHYAIRLLVPPGSALLDQSDTRAWIGELDPGSYSYRWNHPDPRMDALHREVSSIVERGEIERRDNHETFVVIKRAAHSAAGIGLVPEVREPAGRWMPPKLTESWFC